MDGKTTSDKGPSDTVVDLTPNHLLLLIDRDNVAQRMEQALPDTPATLQRETTTQHAIDYCREHSVDAVLLCTAHTPKTLTDLQGKLTDVPIIVLLEEKETDTAAQIMESGASAFITEALWAPETLWALIRKTVRDHKVKLQKEQKLYDLQALVDTIPTPVFYKDKLGVYTGCNQAFEKFIGRASDDIIGKTVFDMAPREIADEYHRRDLELLGHPAKQHYEWKVKRAGGELRDVIFDKASLLDEDGEVRGLIGVITDITDMKRNQAELKERVKEQNCLYGMARLVERPNITLDEILQGVTALIRDAWQYPDHACVRISLHGREFRSDNWKPVPHRHLENLKVHGDPVGVVEVGYATLPNGADEPAFLDEERALLQAVTERLGRIIERYKAEEARRESEEKFRSVVDNISIGVALLDQDLRIRFLNKQMKTWFPDVDYGSGPICYEAYNNPPRKEPCSYCPTIKTLKDGQVHESETETPAGDSVMNFRLVSSPIKNSNGEVVAAVEMVDDVTERRKAERALKESEERYRSLIENINVGIYRSPGDPEGRFLQANPALARMHGFNSVDALMKTPISELYVDPEEREGFVMELLKKGSIKNYELRLKRRDGSSFWASCTATAHLDADGNIKWIDGLIEDVTERKAIDQMKSEFVSIASHELRTPLTNIQESISQVLDGLYGDIEEDQRAVLNISHRNCLRLGRIIHDFLDVSRIESGKIVLKKSFFDMKQLLERALPPFADRAKSRNITIKTEFAEQVPALLADEDRMEQVIVNLVGNAIKFTPKGGTITVSLSENSGFIECAVRDTGIGMSPDNLRQLFTKFKRFAQSPDVEQTGAGLGLVITRELVEMHGGEIRVTSEEGKGSCFTAVLPDPRSRQSLEGKLAHILADNRQTGDLSLLSVSVDSKEEAIPAALFDLLAVRLAEALDPRRICWVFGEAGEIIIVLPRSDAERSQGDLQKIRMVLSRQRIRRSGKVIDLKFNAGLATLSDKSADLKSLSESAHAHAKSQPAITAGVRHILVVDDERSEVKRITNALKGRSFSAEGAHDGKEALEAIGKHKPDLVLMDLFMPVMTGYEVLGYLRSDTETEDLPVIVMSAYEVDEEKLKTARATAVPTLSKPIDAGKLVEKLKETLKLQTIDL